MTTWKSQWMGEIRGKASEAWQIREKIAALRWKPGAAVVLGGPGASRTRRALAPFRRPETGPERDALWREKRRLGGEARVLLLLYGMLRGRPYARIEPRCRDDNRPSPRILWRALEARLGAPGTGEGVDPSALPAGPALAGFTEASIRAWIDGVEAPRVEAA